MGWGGGRGLQSIVIKLNMELDLQSLFGLRVHSWTPKRGPYWSAKIDDISLWAPGNVSIPKAALKIKFKKMTA